MNRLSIFKNKWKEWNGNKTHRRTESSRYTSYGKPIEIKKSHRHVYKVNIVSERNKQSKRIELKIKKKKKQLKRREIIIKNKKTITSDCT